MAAELGINLNNLSGEIPAACVSRKYIALPKHIKGTNQTSESHTSTATMGHNTCYPVMPSVTPGGGGDVPGAVGWRKALLLHRAPDRESTW